MSSDFNYLDLFAGAGGLSEGFIRAGYNPIAHVEMDQAACCTLRTRMAYHWLKEKGDLQSYIDYLQGDVSREEFYISLPDRITQSVINVEIGEETLQDIFQQIDLLLEDRELNLIVGGPPCQTYSHIGRSRCPNRMKGDPRNDLYLFYAEFLREYEPNYFVFENVPGLLSATDEEGNSYLGLMQDLFREYGYETEFETLNAKDYGVPQNRKRIILVGKKGTSTGFYPKPSKCKSDILVKDILSDLPHIKSGEGCVRSCSMKSNYHSWLHETGIRNEVVPVTLHQARTNNKQDREIYKRAVELWNDTEGRLQYNELPERLQTHKNKNSFLNRFKVVAGDLPYCHTIVAHIAMDGHYYIHPDIKQNRSLTPREAARMQTFPDDYYFESSSGNPARTPAYRQIGNAVPVLLGEKIAEKLKENWQ
ncbi:MAG: DNA cytosine methyltransferase [Gammaproteobacteria bacterium]|nr:DNA cytosine methyltransferase [Candidatus Poribacteria bacterium]MYK43387.1 DNA cytosine methyltransferase [Gammaproteobacteria bacterium]